MFKVVYTATRQSATTVFFPRSKRMEELAAVARSNGELLKEFTSFSEDKLVRTYTAIWSSKEALDKFNEEDAVKDFAKRKRWYEQQTDQSQRVTEIII